MATHGYPSYNHPNEIPLKGTYDGTTYRWDTALTRYKLQPERFPQWIYFEDEHCRVIYDPYPKANVHLLVLPLNDSLPTQVSEFNVYHLLELKKVHNVARGIAKCINERHGVKFWDCKIGYHARPAMSDLHLHIITQDFDSEKLKNKKHWNSFNTQFFVTIDKVEQDLEFYGEVNLLEREKLKELLKNPLKCHRCGLEFRFLPKLKHHLDDPCIEFSEIEKPIEEIEKKLEEVKIEDELEEVEF